MFCFLQKSIRCLPFRSGLYVFDIDAFLDHSIVLFQKKLHCVETLQSENDFPAVELLIYGHPAFECKLALTEGWP